MKKILLPMNKQCAETIDNYMNRFRGKDFANRTLARQIVRENPGLFEQNEKAIEMVRGRIRYLRGAQGPVNRMKVGKEFYREEQKPSEYMKAFMERAEPTLDQQWYLPESIKKPLVISDLHIPYHDYAAIMTALDHGFARDIDAIYINGDLIDFAKISRWAKDPTGPRVQVEIDMVREFLNGIVALGLPVFWKIGNHEDRWNFYLIQQAPELSDLDALQISNVLDLHSLDIELIGSRQMAMFGSLVVIHGHEFGQSFFNPVNPARGLFLRAKTSALAGHNHQTSKHSESNLNGKEMSCFSTGCLCDMRPEYRPFAFTKWNLGAAIVELDGAWFDVENFEIINNRVVR